MRPPATMGVECVSVPSCAVHFMFLPVLGSKEPGKPFSADSMLRDQACPHCGWAAADAGKCSVPGTKLQQNNTLQIPNRPRQCRRPQRRSNETHRAQIQPLFIGNNSTENPNGRRRRSAGYVRLPEHPKLMTLQNLFGNIIVLHAQAKDGFALSMRDEGVKVVDVELGFEEGGHEVVQFGG